MGVIMSDRNKVKLSVVLLKMLKNYRYFLLDKCTGSKLG
jgi:hypothetical protein